MSEVVLEVEELSKLYRLGTIGSGSLRQDVAKWWTTSVLKKENPFFHPGEDLPQTSKQFLWALKDVSFQVNEGEALGIIGRNGSGKSTLLKVISRIVSPTKGFVKGKGKISSILEVGTGFNPEFTGRQNIFISGYILGMNKTEINSKFDEIVAFSGIERFIDTPVKRYSSGMYLRLAFAVAAHLEPDILIVDEVLAVGDADFQQKCLGKMSEASKSHGRTILFVSHNLQAIGNLCNKVLWLQEGKLMEIGKTAHVIKNYLNTVKINVEHHSWKTPESAPGNDLIKMKSILAKPHTVDTENQNNEINTLITVRTPIVIESRFWCFFNDCNINVNVRLLTVTGECVFDLGSPSLKAEKGIIALHSVIPGNLLNNAVYSITLTVVKNHSYPIHEFSNCIDFTVEDVRDNINYFGKWPGIIRPQIETYLYISEDQQ
jgi:lipopolysaccharide transport system ATP-binding protein